MHRCRACCALVEIYGAALLAEEMEQVTPLPVDGHSRDSKNQAEALDALMRAMVQLPGYLDRVLAAAATCALVLLPLLNDLRAVRGSPLLSEGTLLLLNLKSDQQARPQRAVDGETAPTRRASGRASLRSRFQLGADRLDPRRATSSSTSRSWRTSPRQFEQVGGHAAAVPAVVGGRAP